MNDIMMTLLKHLNIYAIIRNYILVRSKMRSMHDIKLLITWVGLSIFCLHPADDVRESISCPVELIMSFFHHREHVALKSPAIIKHSGNALFILLITK